MCKAEELCQAIGMDRFKSTKFLLTFGMLVGVFWLKGIGRDVSDLSLVLPLILGFYIGGNVMQDVLVKRKQDNG